MPLYEYACPAYGAAFEQLRPMSAADDPAPCPACATRPPRRLSLVATRRGPSVAAEVVAARPRLPLAHNGCACCTPRPSLAPPMRSGRPGAVGPGRPGGGGTA